MGFAVPPKGSIGVILGDTSSRSFSFPRLLFYTSSPCPFSRGKQHASLQISSRPIKHRVSACSNDSALDENYSPSGKSPSSKDLYCCLGASAASFIAPKL
ncbi:hypothetical protein KSP40_PGU002264 [Platanthera guangdongensis]|uniref:Uncharacterized protein n=1 Tax=Platanthera guangdongensis TaxID=2320717 RepID=A0ABR2LF33_9ASPA